ncbi:interleukin-18 receptor 1-like [Polypterus senegalus]|uniref:interleukin-18 receptor 1-like n=1 Tax=Polypterus senegalus TaxID=55291 RepID=UPI001964AE3F|nr:interleukin-18 receptor 1-like [Polypterus senegalus]
MNLKDGLLLLLTLLISRSHQGDTSDCFKSSVNALEGESAVLRCSPETFPFLNDTNFESYGLTVTWRFNPSRGKEHQFTNLSNIKKKGLYLLIANVALEDSGGSYSCTIYNGTDTFGTRSFLLNVYKGKCFNESSVYLINEFTGKHQELSCPDLCQFPWTSPDISWQKDCKDDLVSSGAVLEFKQLSKADAGNYICRYSFEYEGVRYNISRTRQLRVKDEPEELIPDIIQPDVDKKQVYVEVGKGVSIDCVVVVYTKDDLDFSDIYWREENKSEAIKCDKQREKHRHNYHIKVKLNLTKVVKEDIGKTYICYLESSNNKGNKNVSVILVEKINSTDITQNLFIMGVSLAAIFITLPVTLIIICVVLRVEIVLIYRKVTGKDETVGDGKDYDAYVTWCKSSTTPSYHAEEEKFILETMPSVLEKHFNYRLCIYERDVLPGGAFVDNTLEYIGKSRRMILILSGKNVVDESHYELVTGLHSDLVEKKIQVILIEYKPLKDLKSLPESLRLLVKERGTVKWKDSQADNYNSRFWKKMRYYMPAKKMASPHTDEMNLL